MGRKKKTERETDKKEKEREETNKKKGIRRFIPFF